MILPFPGLKGFGNGRCNFLNIEFGKRAVALHNLIHMIPPICPSVPAGQILQCGHGIILTPTPVCVNMNNNMWYTKKEAALYIVVHLVEGIHIWCRFGTIPLIGHNRAGMRKRYGDARYRRNVLPGKKKLGGKRRKRSLLPPNHRNPQIFADNSAWPR